jgi:hypothetical protein
VSIHNSTTLPICRQPSRSYLSPSIEVSNPLVPITIPDVLPIMPAADTSPMDVSDHALVTVLPISTSDIVQVSSATLPAITITPQDFLSVGPIGFSTIEAALSLREPQATVLPTSSSLTYTHPDNCRNLHLPKHNAPMFVLTTRQQPRTTPTDVRHLVAARTWQAGNIHSPLTHLPHDLNVSQDARQYLMILFDHPSRKQMD